MINLRWITHLETFAVNARFHALVSGDVWKGDTQIPQVTDETHKTLMLRARDPASGDAAPADLPVLAEWKSMRSLLSRARRAILADPVFGQALDHDAPLGSVGISVLKPQTAKAWMRDLGEHEQRHFRFYVALITNPRCQLYAGGEQIHVAQGSLVFLNTLAEHSEVNFGEAPSAHLVLELRRFLLPEQSE
jgi:hypothetical protein